MKRFSTARLILSITFAAIISLGKYIRSFFRLPGFIAFFMGVFVICYAILSYIDQKQDQYDSFQTIPQTRFTVHRPFVMFFLILIVLWIPYVILSFPGNIPYDTGTSILSYLGMINNPNNPVFLNLLYGWIYKFGVLIGSPDLLVFICCFAQVVLFAMILSESLVLVYSSNAPLSIVIILLFLYGLLPIFPLYAFCMGKDSLLALLTLQLSILLFEICRKEDFSQNKRKIVLLYLTVIFIPLVRNNAIWMVVLCLLPLVKKKRFLIFPLAIALFSTALFHFLVPAPEKEIAEVLSIPIQQTGYVVHQYTIPADEMSIINKVLPADVLEDYTPQNADPLKDHFNKNHDPIALRAYFRIWFTQLYRYPVAYAKAFYWMTNGYYTPGILCNDIKPHIIVGYCLSEQAASSLALGPNQNRGLPIIHHIDDIYNSLPLIGTFQSIGIYTWLLIITWFNGYRRKMGPSLICLMPSFIIFLGCCLSPINGYFRYAFPMILSVPVVCMLIFFTPKPTPTKIA